MGDGYELGSSVKLLLVTRNAALVADLTSRLGGFDMVALTEATTRHALGARSDVLDGVRVAVLDGSVPGGLRLRLYDRLRPTGRAACTPVIFSRSGFGAARHETGQGSDLYLPAGASVAEMAWWCRSLTGSPAWSVLPHAVAPAACTSLARIAPATPSSDTSALAPAEHLPLDAASTSRAGEPLAQAAASSGRGWVAQAGLWGVVAALSLVTIWPDAGRSAVADAMRGYLRTALSVTWALADATAVAEDGAARHGPR